jgi:D-arabinose 1-dehydrogenase-like Zn-dependent alcohol dehydrogenase
MGSVERTRVAVVNPRHFDELCERVKPGWRVLLPPGLSCRQCAQCVSGQDNLCRRHTVFGYRVDGNAEYLVAPEYSVALILRG